MKHATTMIGFASRHRHVRRSIRSRRGISLLEVLFSIGIISIGLLGVVTLLPLAANQVRKGAEADQAAMIGINALNTFELTEMANTSSWTHPDYPMSAVSSRDSICIDPRFVADNVLATSPTPYDKTRFPHYERGLPMPDRPRMRRVSLLNGAGGRMSKLQANRIFMDEDRLNFERPDDDTKVAQPRFQALPTSAGGGNAVRESRGDLSWFATLVPQLGPGVGPGGLYTLSIAVLQGRPGTVNFDTFADLERLANVTAFYSDGLSGGDIRVAAGVLEVLEDIKVGEWLMLAAKANHGSAQIDRFSWYRVGAVTEITGTGPYEREVTLSGPDWSRNEWTTLAQPTEAVIVPGVVGVFERTIRLEQTNLWK